MTEAGGSQNEGELEQAANNLKEILRHAHANRISGDFYRPNCQYFYSKFG